MFPPCWLFILNVPLFVNSQLVNINVGILIPNGLGPIDKQVGYKTSAGAVITGLNRATALGLYDPTKINITFSWYFDQGEEGLSAGYAAKLIYDNHVNVILGPVFPESSYVVSALATYKQIPVFLWGAVAPNVFYDRITYPAALPFAGTVRGMFSSLSYVLTNFNWTKIAFMYTTSPDVSRIISTCEYFAETFELQAEISANISETYNRHAVNTTVSGFTTILRSMNTRARIIVNCLETAGEKRNYLRAAKNLGMVSAEYVHIFVQSSSTDFGNPPFWDGASDDGLDDAEEIKESAKSVLILDKYINTTEVSSEILKGMADNIHGWPFYCKDCPTNNTGSNLAVYLADNMLTYLDCLNKTYIKYGPSQLKNTTAIMENLAGTKEMPSVIGNTFTMTNGIRAAKYSLTGLDINGNPVAFASIGSTSADGALVTGYNPSYSNAATTIWATRGGFQPTATPKCGFNNELCPPSPWLYTVIIIGCIVIFILVVGSLLLTILLVQRKQRKRLNALWQISYHMLVPPQERNIAKSARSINSTSTTHTNSTIVRKNTDKIEFMYLNGQIVVCRKHNYLSNWTSAEEEEFRKMRVIDNANLNKLLGVSVVGNVCWSIWNFCERGNIIEVIKAHALKFDAFIMYGMIRNIIEGLSFIHNSRFQQHGILSSYNCLVGDRFEVKIQFYGLSGLKSRTFRRLDEHSALYVAPEHLHGQQNEVGSQAGDIYSFAIICSVILTMKPAFGLDEEDDEAETVRAVAKGKYPPVRPSLNVDPSLEINPELTKLIQKCWSEHPPERLKIGEIRDIMLKRISTSRSNNLMDYMFALMENNAVELEQDVQQRTMELLEEQKKADILLYRMMPREAADCLKLGQTVTPEVYESSTVFFSDIVSFTVLASKSTPLQIINFLNEVYTLADAVIEKYDVYKVETIGDGMHVVSGVPRRNGNAHVKAIADMSIDFQRAVKTLRMSHLPEHPVQMRVGVHSGAAVAGIVGLTSPRYIVFGDTVNVSAKMEASGKAGRIHISGSTKALIQSNYPNTYTIVDRGETLIKGIGPMHSHWLVPPEEINTFQP